MHAYQHTLPPPNSHWPIVLGFPLLSLPLALQPTHLARPEVLSGQLWCRTHTHTPGLTPAYLCSRITSQDNLPIHLYRVIVELPSQRKELHSQERALFLFLLLSLSFCRAAGGREALAQIYTDCVAGGHSETIERHQDFKAGNRKSENKCLHFSGKLTHGFALRS